MRIIHTADWHLCDRLGPINRTDDLKSRVSKVAELCQTHAVDVLLIAGDLFYEQATIEEMTRALIGLHEAFASYFQRGGTILVITGNHDREARVEMLRAAMQLASPPAPGRPFLSGRLYLLNRPTLSTLQTRDGERAQFVLVPYPTVSCYAKVDDTFRSKDEENRILHTRVAQEIQNLSMHAVFDPALPTILVAHLHVRGAELHSLYRISERDDVVFDPDLFPSNWAYIALGHIHKPQVLGGKKHIRYPGSLDRLDFGEREDEKGVILLDLGPQGLRADPVWIPIPATPLHDIAITDPSVAFARIAERYPDRETAIVRVCVTYSSTGTGREEILRELRRWFPRCKEISWLKPETRAEKLTSEFRRHADYRATIRKFLEQELAGDVDRQDMLLLAESFLRKESGA